MKEIMISTNTGRAAGAEGTLLGCRGLEWMDCRAIWKAALRDWVQVRIYTPQDSAASLLDVCSREIPTQD